MRHIPNFITSLNLTAGFTAVIFAANGDIVTASWLILAAMIFDFLDGLSARMLKAYSAIGKELDSLADVVSFGVAPGLIIYKVLTSSFSANIPENIHGFTAITFLIIVVTAFMPVCAALRLAIFNIDETQAKSFKGLPTPANALGVIAIVLSGFYSHSPIYTLFSGSPASLMVYSIVLSLMMVSRIPLLSLKMSDFKLKGNEGRLILAGLVLASFIILGAQAAPLIIPIYVLSSLLSLLF